MAVLSGGSAKFSRYRRTSKRKQPEWNSSVEWHEGDVIRKLRDTVRLTLDELSVRSGVNVQVIHKIEKGVTRDPKRATLQRIAAPFGLTAEDIRKLVPDPRIPEVAIRLREAPKRAGVDNDTPTRLTRGGRR